MFKNLLYGVFDGSQFNYVGQTSRPINQRRNEHIRSGNFTPDKEIFMIIGEFETPEELTFAEKTAIQNGWDMGMCSRNKQK